MITLDITFPQDSEEFETVFNKNEEYSFVVGEDNEFTLTFEESV